MGLLRLTELTFLLLRPGLLVGHGVHEVGKEVQEPSALVLLRLWGPRLFCKVW